MQRSQTRSHQKTGRRTEAKELSTLARICFALFCQLFFHNPLREFPIQLCLMRLHQRSHHLADIVCPRHLDCLFNPCTRLVLVGKLWQPPFDHRQFRPLRVGAVLCPTLRIHVDGFLPHLRHLPQDRLGLIVTQFLRFEIDSRVRERRSDQPYCSQGRRILCFHGGLHFVRNFVDDCGQSRERTRHGHRSAEGRGMVGHE
mmetsp:Transcript_4463/g.7782  ORF Transcript_4463/g.7782 Transcript_4463/m.7782 type:complete len:200 (+) Transcript_4463:132-731(+)